MYAWYALSWSTRISSTKFLTQSKSTSATPSLIAVGVTPTPSFVEPEVLDCAFVVVDAELFLSELLHAARVTMLTHTTSAVRARRRVPGARRTVMQTPGDDVLRGR